MARPIRFTFGELDVTLKYSQGVLMPSPFSRLLATTLCDHFPGLISPKEPAHVVALDLGCGSGIQAIVLARLGVAEVYAVDIDPRCVAATEFNALLNEVSEWTASPRMVLAHYGDLFEPVGDIKFDLVVCNPPTMPSGEETPRFASGGSHPRQFLELLIERANQALTQGGRLLFTLSSLAGHDLTLKALVAAGFSYRILRSEKIPFRDFYYPHIGYYRRLKLQKIADFEERPNGELYETVYVVCATLDGHGHAPSP